MPALFSLGQTVVTHGALDALGESMQSPLEFLSRHITGDWGDLCDEDKEQNNKALAYGGRLFSAYRTSNDVKIWIITECDYSVTTILLPSEY